MHVVEPSPEGTTTFGYDPADRLTSIVDAASNQTLAEYRMDGARVRSGRPGHGRVDL